MIEGLDGSGKSTLARQIAVHLDAVLLATPGDALQSIRAPFHLAVAEDPDAMVLFYAASCVRMGREARRIADSGRSVVLDRYLASTLAYGRARGSALNLRDVVSIAPVPDVTVLLSIDELERRRRLQARGANPYDLETLNEGFARVVREEYQRLLRGRTGGRLVESDGAIADVMAALGLSMPPLWAARVSSA